MMTLVLVVIGALIIVFGAVTIFGAPFLPTLKSQIETALELSELKPGQTMLELGCGDGRVLLAAARRGIIAKGIEMNPLLVILAKFRTRHYKDMVNVKWGNYWRLKWPKTDVIFVFLISAFMKKLDNKITQYPNKPVRLVSVAFAIPERKPAALKGAVYLYNYK